MANDFLLVLGDYKSWDEYVAAINSDFVASGAVNDDSDEEV